MTSWSGNARATASSIASSSRRCSAPGCGTISRTSIGRKSPTRLPTVGWRGSRGGRKASRSATRNSSRESRSRRGTAGVWRRRRRPRRCGSSGKPSGATGGRERQVKAGGRAKNAKRGSQIDPKRLWKPSKSDNTLNLEELLRSDPGGRPSGGRKASRSATRNSSRESRSRRGTAGVWRRRRRPRRCGSSGKPSGATGGRERQVKAGGRAKNAKRGSQIDPKRLWKPSKSDNTLNLEELLRSDPGGRPLGVDYKGVHGDEPWQTRNHDRCPG